MRYLGDGNHIKTKIIFISYTDYLLNLKAILYHTFTGPAF
jgi:hypothetical protein